MLRVGFLPHFVRTSKLSSGVFPSKCRQHSSFPCTRLSLYAELKARFRPALPGIFHFLIYISDRREDTTDTVAIKAGQIHPSIIATDVGIRSEARTYTWLRRDYTPFLPPKVMKMRRRSSLTREVYSNKRSPVLCTRSQPCSEHLFGSKSENKITLWNEKWRNKSRKSDGKGGGGGTTQFPRLLYTLYRIYLSVANLHILQFES